MTFRTPVPIALVVEEQRRQRNALGDLLASAGYVVMMAKSGLEGAALIMQLGPRLAALITDIYVGAGPNGWELASRARELSANALIVYVTSSDRGVWDVLGAEGSVFLRKPAPRSQVLSAVSSRTIGRALA